MKQLFTLILFFFTVFVHSQNVSDIQNIEKKIDSLQTKIDSLKNNITDANDIFDKAQNTYDTAKNIFEIKASLINWIGIILSILVVVGGFIGWKWIKNHIYEQLKNAIEKEIKGNSNLISGLLKKYAKESELLKGSKILIINKKNTNTDKKFEMVIKRFEEVNLDILNIDDFNKESIFNQLQNINRKIDKYDAVIIDNIDDSLNKDIWDFNKNNRLKDKLVELVNLVCKNGSVFLFFGENDGKFSDEIIKEYRHLINYSKNPATLFANLIDLLDFKRLIK